MFWWWQQCIQKSLQRLYVNSCRHTRTFLATSLLLFSTFLAKSQPLEKRFIVGFVKSQQGKSSVHRSAVEFLLSGFIISFACQRQLYVMFLTFLAPAAIAAVQINHILERGKSSSVQSSQKETTLNLRFSKLLI